MLFYFSDFKVNGRYCAHRFDNAAKELAARSDTSESVKKILASFSYIIVDLKQCFVFKLVGCLRDAVRDVGIEGMIRRIADTKGDENQLLKQIFDVNLKVYGNMSGLTLERDDRAIENMCEFYFKNTD